MSKKLGELPAWGGFLITLAGCLLAAGVAWGTTSFRLNKHDEELKEIKAEISAFRAENKAVAEALATLLERTKGL